MALPTYLHFFSDYSEFNKNLQIYSFIKSNFQIFVTTFKDQQTKKDVQRVFPRPEISFPQYLHKFVWTSAIFANRIIAC